MVPIIGAIVVLVAIGYLVHYAIEIGLIGRIGPLARFMLGVGLGLLLLAAGEFVRRRGVPGTAIGLDGAGIGAIMVSTALGVFTLQIFGPATGALIAGGAGVFGAWWSVRSGSAAVGIVALLGFFGIPPAVGLYRDEPRLAVLLLTLALATGLAMHILGSRKFAPVRIFALVATILLGIVALAATRNPIEACGYALVWWAIIAGDATLCALRGIARRSNIFVLCVASSLMALVEVGSWTTAAGSISVIEFLPSVVGALLFAQSMFLRGFVMPVDDPHDAAELDQSTRASSEACSDLSRTAAALALALGVGGLAFLVTDALKGALVLATAIAAIVLSRRVKSRALDAVGAVMGWIGAITALAVVAQRRVATVDVSFSLPFSSADAIEIHWSASYLGLIAASCLLFVGVSMARTRVAAAALMIPCTGLWVAVSAVLFQSRFACLALILPAAVVAWIPRARLLTVLISMLLWCFGAALWLTLSERVPRAAGLGRTECDVPALVFVFAIGLPIVCHIAMHAALGSVRTMLVLPLMCIAAGGLAVIACTESLGRGTSGLQASIAVATTLAAAGLVAILVGSLWRRPRVVDGGMIVSLVAVLVGVLFGYLRFFQQAPSTSLELDGLLVAVLVMGASLLTAVGATRRLGEAGAWRHQAAVVVASCSIAPLGTIILAELFGTPMGSAVAVSWMGGFGVGALLVGFRQAVPPLRWAGLAALLFLVVRLYFIELAETTLLVRIALLLVTGLVLVGTGYIYAKSSRRSAGAA